MSCLGVHFALTDDEAATLVALGDENERLEHIQEEIEEKYISSESDYAAESDKSWDALHRLLSDGNLTWDGGEYPLNHVVLAGQLLYTGDDYIMSLKTAAQVRDIAAALEGLDEEEFRRRYYNINADDYDADLNDEDLDYTWSCLMLKLLLKRTRGLTYDYRHETCVLCKHARCKKEFRIKRW